MGTAGRDGGGGDGGLFGREEQREGSPIPCTELPAGRTDVAGPLYRAQQGERGANKCITVQQQQARRRQWCITGWRETGNQSRANASCSAPNTIPSDANVPECNAFAMEHQAVLLIKSQ